MLHAAPPDYSELDYAPFGTRLPPAQTAAEAAAVTTNGLSNGSAVREQVGFLALAPPRVAWALLGFRPAVTTNGLSNGGAVRKQVGFRALAPPRIARAQLGGLFRG